MYIYPLSHKEVEKKVVLPSLFAQEGKKEREREKRIVTERSILGRWRRRKERSDYTVRDHVTNRPGIRKSLGSASLNPREKSNSDSWMVIKRDFDRKDRPL